VVIIPAQPYSSWSTRILQVASFLDQWTISLIFLYDEESYVSSSFKSLDIESIPIDKEDSMAPRKRILLIDDDDVKARASSLKMKSLKRTEIEVPKATDLDLAFRKRNKKDKAL